MMDFFRLRFRTYSQSWNRFWFESHSPEQMTVLRFSIGIMLLCFYSIRAMDLQWFFSENGIMTTETMLLSLPMDYRFTLLSVFRSPTALVVLHTGFLISLFTMAMGWWPRVSAIIAFFLHISFLHRNMPVAFGADLISTFILLYLCLADTANVHTTSQAKNKNSLSWQLSSMGYRLTQIQICIIYAFSGLEKLKGVAWWKGEAIWTVVANAQLARFDFGWTAHFPIVVSVATYLTLLWEIYFMALVWVPSFRRFTILFGALFHLGIGLVVNIPYFSLLMVLSYSVFLSQAEAKWILQRIKPLKAIGFRSC